jgi:predicted nucleic acid-binding Zn ribbon protein
MPIYEFSCTRCATSRDVIVDHGSKNELELLCVQCGAMMRAVEVSLFSITCSSTGTDKARARHSGAKSCGHTHACRCSVKMTRPNPFQAQVDAALGKVEPE